MTLRQHKRRYCGRFIPGFRRWSWKRNALFKCKYVRPYSRCNPVTYGG
jgi:hypothetical protein